ncbi:hypothetical protein A2631_01420 [Candidatus Daviesbacteria bacterium RIFCSPHIGHO2_01_FULL_44_29]|uniref:Uncharacterized protein n=1 Tax=Candidatus Daviesbacteria bacterium RIFCSPHIGHO2_02_FULL_43_12 TaxID=1797776 RepID=A0A1F5KLR7_9BACT|nr:MAG: hypothetical protein A2631_01420 [Candidatus Daviesbacteria bacterium RIFCSPHIGHO2_01_FULL_44_29]OGE39691.1 MAG: hypothetical protein A3E86_00120 [Candidatus Daviesbacteria bacterium RIFCSPHIGHO2_12_FULL_47_45]OGE41551.1 MAG: hypothetical protein A3D25_00840 [Candidatus Daviesbacteria bacterium RIFCSPHIGHO2_02_FULL_43_12]OGE69833.1 MAG: hypothetical protein A3B55_05485 [Candidatus Daviesbacteria bacterium RIFCSPLOWO2_01_FULL_43_15]
MTKREGSAIITDTLDHWRISRAIRRHGKDRVMQLLERALRRQGLVLFGGPEVLTHRTILSPELIYEMVSVATQPFGQQEVVGIKVSNLQEREELFNVVHN